MGLFRVTIHDPSLSGVGLSRARIHDPSLCGVGLFRVTIHASPVWGCAGLGFTTQTFLV